MNLWKLSIERPVFTTCVFLTILALGALSTQKLAVDLFPNVSFPVVYVATPYPGAGPEEIETLITKPIEDEVGTIAGLKNLYSVNKEGSSVVIAEFTLSTDVRYAEQQVRDRVALARTKLPTGVDEAYIRKMDPADQPIVILSLQGDLTETELYDLADQKVKPRIEQVDQVGLVEIMGGRKREIRVELDRKKLADRNLSVSMISQRLGETGQNIPAGKIVQSDKEMVFRTLGEFKKVDEIQDTIVSFFGNDIPVTLGTVGRVVDGLEEEKSRAYTNGKKSVFLFAFRQSGANTISVVDGVKALTEPLNKDLQQLKGHPHIEVVRDGAKPIRANVQDVLEAIILGAILCVLVVYLFLGNFRSTVITGMALPNSLLGAFILMWIAGFTINLMTLLALSLAIGLIVDDAIVVRENIFRFVQKGMSPIKAAIEGTREVALACIATTLTVMAVFGPVAFLEGVVGQFFLEFGLTICFVMAISLLDAFTMAPMLSAYYAGVVRKPADNWFMRTIRNPIIDGFDRFQTRLEHRYEGIMRRVIKRPLFYLGCAALFIAASVWVLIQFVPKTFLPAQDFGEFSIQIDLPAGTSLEAMDSLSKKIDQMVRANSEIQHAVMIIGNRDGEPNETIYYVELVPRNQRSLNTSQVKDKIREQLKQFHYANPRVQDIDMVGGGARPFTMNLLGADLDILEKFSAQAFEKIKNHPGLKDVDLGFRPGKPEIQFVLDHEKAQRLGVSSSLIGKELRAQVEGVIPAVFRQEGQEYDIRTRLQESNRNLSAEFDKVLVPNVNQRLVRLADVAEKKETIGPAKITRQNRTRYIQITADLAPEGPGFSKVMDDISHLFAEELPLPHGVRYEFVGDAENFRELQINMMIAAALGILFIFLIMASLYESFIIPISLMVALPLAVCGAFYALAITQKSLDIFSMIGCILLLGIVMKNSILVVDYANQLLERGYTRLEAVILAGKTRLRPILMTSMALIAGMLPIAIGLNEASRQRTSMGVAVIGGLISSTFLSLLVIPITFLYFDRLRVWSQAKAIKFFKVQDVFTANGNPTDEKLKMVGNQKPNKLNHEEDLTDPKASNS